MPRCTLRQAARALGCSLSTLRRRIAAGDLQAVQEDGPHGPRWLVDLEPDQPGAVGAVPGAVGAVHADQPGAVHGAVGAVQPDQPGAVPGAVQPALLEMLQQALAQKDAAQDRAREAEVQAAGQVALARGELEAYRRALAENAASLAEREARARAAEAQAQDLQSRMEQEQMRQAAEVQDLRARLARVPGWLRRLLGVE